MNLASIQKVSGLLEINGEIIEAIDTVTMVGLETVASCLGSPFNFTKAWMPYIAMGQGETEPSTEDKYLENEKYRAEATVTYNVTSYIANVLFDDITTAFILREVAMLNKSAGGRMAAIWALASELNIAVGDNVDITCTIYIA